MSYFKGFGTGSNSNGQFWYGGSQGFPGFLYKKNTGIGGRKNPLYGLICNKPTYLYNKYKPGSGGVGAQNRANRRAKNTRATVCVDHNCGRFYNYLGLYPRYSYKSIDGYFPYPLPLEKPPQSLTVPPSGGLTVPPLTVPPSGGLTVPQPASPTFI